MDLQTLHQLLQSVADGKLPVENAAKTLANISSEDIDYAHIDHHRSLRKGFPEVIFGQGKTPDQIIGIMDKMALQENVILVTRIDRIKADKVCEQFPDAVYHEDARMVVLKKHEMPNRGRGTILILSAGTSDIPVAKEAYITAEAMGNSVKSVFDVGVAGIHRLFRHKELIEEASVLIVAAGMEGALPSIVGGYVACPVFGVPTSVGYGASFGGIAPLLSMLNSCAANVAVVNIDAGFKAAYLAGLIATRTATALS